MKARWFLVGMLLGALMSVGCATEVGTIDRTQADKLEKKLFAGVWFMTQEVIDIAYNGAFSFVGEMNFGSTSKIVFDVQKDMLVVYPVTEYIQDSEKDYHKQKLFRYWEDKCTTLESEKYPCVDGVDNINDPDKLCCFVEMYVGQPLAAFDITSHFDVTREYNSSTGSQGNVIEENDYDKQWWQRKYIRVNWSRNNVNDFTFMARMINQSPVDYYVQEFESGNPDAPTFSEDYIDVVTKVFGEPASTGSCDIYAVSAGDCTSAVLKFRTAFRKADVAQNYEPQRYASEEESKLFGYFLTSRNGWDKDYGVTEGGKVYWANRWNIWQNSFDEDEIQIETNDAEGNKIMVSKPCFKDLSDTGCDTTLVDGTREFCRADGWFQHGTCVVRRTLPYVERGLTPILYSTSANLPEDFWPATQKMADEWSSAFKDTVAWLYFWEEKGQIRGSERVRTCETNADCAGHAIVDKMFDLDKVEDESMLPMTSGTPTYSKLSMTVVVGPDGKAVSMQDWKYPDGLNASCAVRFVNIGSDAATLAVNDAALASNVAKMAEDSFNPDLPKFDKVGKGSLNLKVTAGAKTAESTVECAPSTIVLVVFNGTDIVTAIHSLSKVSGQESTGTPKGIRVINAGNIALDVSVNGGIRAYNVVPGQSSGYSVVGGGVSKKADENDQTLPAGFVPQRLVCTEAGSAGDVTCYTNAGRSFCAGYNSPLKPEDFERVETIKTRLPEMFVLCHNSYMPAEGENLNDDQYKSRFYAPWSEIKNLTDEQIAELPEKNPCVDFLFNADKMTEDQKLEQAYALKKAGDSRYSMVYWVSEAQFSSPLGYGPTAADPDSGQIFWGVANIYGAYIYYYQNLYRDFFELLRGKLNTSDYITGENIRRYVLSKEEWKENEEGGSTNRKAAMLSLADSARDMNAAKLADDNSREIGRVMAARGKNTVTFDQMISTIRKLQKDKDVMATLPSNKASFGKDRLSLLKGTRFEQLLNTEEVAYATKESGLESPLDWMNLETINKAEIDRHRLLGQKAYCFYEFEDEGLIGIVKAWACMPNDTRPICDTKTFDPLGRDNVSSSTCCIDDAEYLGKAIGYRMYEGVVIHEVGHTVGLRHNFSASTDLFNYYDKYYDIREKEAVPCVSDSECDQISGHYCGEGYCKAKLAETCTTDFDCGAIARDGTVMYYDSFKCISNKCNEVKTCGLHGECPAGMYCDGGRRLCLDAQTKDLVATPVTGGENFVRQFIPRAEMTEQEANLSRTIYQYTSIMDYGQRFNSDILGIGKYDRAAIRFGYGRLADVYTDTAKLHRTVQNSTQAYGDSDDLTNSWNLDTSGWNYGVYFSQFYYLNNFIGVDQNRAEGEFTTNRSPVPYDRIRDEHNLAYNYYRQEHDWSYVMVPYKYDGDEWRGNVGVYTWDTGVDILEIIHNMNINLSQYYLMDAFKRERYGFGLGGNPLGYMSRIQERYMDPMRGAAMYYALYSHLLKNYSWRGMWANARLMGWALRRSSEYGFEILANSMASPAPGSFKLNTATNVFENVSFSENAQGSELNIPLGDGKYPFTTFWDGAGYYYFDHAQYLGSFWEKMAALMTLTDSTVYFTSNYVGEQLDIGVGTSLGFNTMYPRQLVELIGGLAVEEPEYFAYEGSASGASPHRYFDTDNPDAYVVNPAPYFTALGPATGKTVEPSVDNLTIKLYGMLYGMAYLPASFDPSFVDSFAVCLVGTPECHELGPQSGIVPVDFQEPFSGKTYRVWGPTYATDWFSPNVTIVDKANALKAEWEAAADADKPALEQELRKYVEVLDLMRGIYQVYSNIRI